MNFETNTYIPSCGLAFACTRCSGCCRHQSGYVFISENDLDKLVTAKYKIVDKNSIKRFVSEYCRVVQIGGGKMLSLLEKTNNDCIFWQDDGCQVYEARPIQCVTYPFWPRILHSKSSWEKEAASCPGIGRGTEVSYERIRCLLNRTTALKPVVC